MECKLCSRKFANGKALGGHMRSHFAALPLPPKTPQRQELELSEPTTDSTSSIDDSGDKSSLLSGSYVLREKPRKSQRLVDPNFCDSVVDRGSESGSTRARCKRGKGMSREDDDQEVIKRRLLQKAATEEEEEPLISELEMEEDVASCLVMLSRDVWRGNSEMREKIYKCDKCERVFKSTQGLGSHRANHHDQRKIKKILINDDVIRDNQFGKLENHECGFCGKVFKSGKALGGHKRVHLQASSSSSKLGTSLVELEHHDSPSLVEHHPSIDLNLPPEIEDQELDSFLMPKLKMVKRTSC